MNKKLSIITNILIVILEIIGLIVTYKTNNRIAIEYYTEDSNILMLISSTLFLVYIFLNKKVPRFIELFKYMTTICVTITFLVVLFILSPMYGFNYIHMFFYNELLFHHLLCPILSFITLVYFDDIGIINKKDTLIGLSLTLIYAVILVILNIFNVVIGPYPFLMIYNQSMYVSIIWFILIFSLVYLISYMIRRLYNKRRSEI